MKSLQRIFYSLCIVIWERFVRSLQQRTVFTFFVITVFLIAVSAVTFRLAEHDERESLWRTVVYIVSGLDVDPPQTTFGRTVAAFAVFSGVILVSMLTAFLASEFSRVLVSAQSIRKKPPEHILEDHVVIVGWGPKRKEVLRQLEQTWREKGYAADDIVIISDQEHLDRGEELIYENVWHVRGNPTDVDALREADLVPGRGKGARVALILGDFTGTPQENDRVSLLQLLAIEHLNPSVISLAEVQDGRNIEHFKNANADEVIPPNDYAGLLLARTAEYRGLATWMDELLALAFGQDEQIGTAERHPISFYMTTPGEIGLEGRTIDEAVLAHYERTGYIIAGLLRAGEILLYPEIERPSEHVLGKNDTIVAISRPEGV